MCGPEGPESEHSGISDNIRQQLVVLARRSRARITEFRRDRPTEWRPQQVRNPEGVIASHFSDAEAWELIASLLERGHPVEVVELRHPPGATGYVMMVDLGVHDPPIYVKLQLGGGRIIGRSFHYSEHG